MSAKLKDDKNRWRNKTVSFRASPEEAEELDRRVRLCGARTKQDYILKLQQTAGFLKKIQNLGNIQT